MKKQLTNSFVVIVAYLSPILALIAAGFLGIELLFGFISEGLNSGNFLF